jgi:hypothetical protein
MLYNYIVHGERLLMGMLFIRILLHALGAEIGLAINFCTTQACCKNFPPDLCFLQHASNIATKFHGIDFTASKCRGSGVRVLECHFLVLLILSNTFFPLEFWNKEQTLQLVNVGAVV